jgi:hypothetical protein
VSDILGIRAVKIGLIVEPESIPAPKALQEVDYLLTGKFRNELTVSYQFV